MNQEKLKTLAKDLRTEYPRSPRETIGGYVIAARCVDKCRSFLLGINGEYNFWPCSLCSEFETFTDINHEDLKDFVATGATDDEIGEWITQKSNIQSRIAVIRWNNKMRDMRPSEMSDEGQEYLEDYIPQYLPKHRPVYVWFDLYDLEEGRL
ncbi:MAG: DUF5069 domain-containing protein [bacterium]|nr:DUF5069 domain-containing protein [bacterium]